MKEWHPDLALDKLQSTRWIRMFLKGRWISVVLKKRSVCHCRTLGFHLWVGKIPWSREWQPTPVSLPGKFHGQKSLAGYSPWGCKESNTTECVHTHTHTHTHTELPVKWTKSTNLKRLLWGWELGFSISSWKSFLSHILFNIWAYMSNS